MKLFACVLDSDGRGISERIRHRIQTVPERRGLPYRWMTFDGAVVLIAGDKTGLDSEVARSGSNVIVGQVRLDNRDEIGRLVKPSQRGVTDLELIGAAISQFGSAIVSSFLGDFAFVAWDSTSRTAVAACDVFAVRRLYYTQYEGLSLFASRAEPLDVRDVYDRAYLADRLSLDCLKPELTVYAEVKVMRAASVMTVRGRTTTISKYWSPMDSVHGGRTPLKEPAAVEACRDLLTAAICLRLDSGAPTWAHLSGGLDSSSVVSLTQWLAARQQIPRGLGGTVTIVNGAETNADERIYSDAVVERWKVRNEPVVYSDVWEDACPLALLPDQPTAGGLLNRGERQLCGVVQESGGRVLLTGWGSDELFYGNMVYFADLIAHGRIVQAFQSLAHISAVGRVSFWALAYQNALLPFLPFALQQRALRDMYAAPEWVRWDTLRQLGMNASVPDTRYRGPLGLKYRHYVASQVSLLELGTGLSTSGELMDVRHPFLHRPLVEFAMKLPPELCTRPHERKWVLREAMRGILPDVIRTRVGKGGMNNVVQRTFEQTPASFQLLARDPILADLGLIDARQFQNALKRASIDWRQESREKGDILRTFTVEAWLQMRAGRWPHGVIREDAVPRPIKQVQPSAI